MGVNLQLQNKKHHDCPDPPLYRDGPSRHSAEHQDHPAAVSLHCRVFSVRNNDRCLLNQFCQVGTAEGRLPEDSIAKALYESYNVVNTVLQTSSRSNPMPNMQKIKSAYELGQKTRKVQLCSEVFECAD